MEKEHNLSILQIIYGFVIITAIDSVLRFIVYLIFYGEIELSFQNNIIIYSIPIITVALYFITAFFIIKKVNKTPNLIVLSKGKFILLSFIAIFLNPITNKISGLFGEYRSTGDLSIAEYLSSYGMMVFILNLSSWLVLIFIVLYFLKKNKFINENS